MNILQKISLSFIVTIFYSTLIGCEIKNEDTTSLEKKIIALDKAGWEAWKNKNGEWFEQNTTSNFVSISADGVSNKKEVIAATVSKCAINSYELGSMKFILLNDKSVLLTYVVIQDGTCDGVKLNSKIQVAANYIFQNNKWLEAFYMESKIE